MYVGGANQTATENVGWNYENFSFQVCRMFSGDEKIRVEEIFATSTGL